MFYEGQDNYKSVLGFGWVGFGFEVFLASTALILFLLDKKIWGLEWVFFTYGRGTGYVYALKVREVGRLIPVKVKTVAFFHVPSILIVVVFYRVCVHVIST